MLVKVELDKKDVPDLGVVLSRVYAVLVEIPRTAIYPIAGPTYRFDLYVPNIEVDTPVGIELAGELRVLIGTHTRFDVSPTAD